LLNDIYWKGVFDLEDSTINSVYFTTTSLSSLWKSGFEYIGVFVSLFFSFLYFSTRLFISSCAVLEAFLILFQNLLNCIKF
jgi:hypothetical protein